MRTTFRRQPFLNIILVRYLKTCPDTKVTCPDAKNTGPGTKITYPHTKNTYPDIYYKKTTVSVAPAVAECPVLVAEFITDAHGGLVSGFRQSPVDVVQGTEPRAQEPRPENGWE